jgi:DNA-directed RNA polymerase specialized sigma subunit
MTIKRGIPASVQQIKLREQRRKKIQALYARGFSDLEIGNLLNLTRQRVWQIRTG